MRRDKLSRLIRCRGRSTDPITLYESPRCSFASERARLTLSPPFDRLPPRMSPRTSARPSAHAQSLIRKIENHSAQLGVIGLGYVGLPLAVELGHAGFRVTGFDIDEKRVAKLNRGISYIQDVPTHDVKKLVETGHFAATTDFSRLRKMDAVNVCVPTPLSKMRDPDVSFVVSAFEQVAKYLRPGQLLILESTTYPGTTDELILPMLAKSGLTVGKDFFL